MRTKLLSILAAIMLFTGWCIPAFSQGIMPLPHAFYGNLTVNGAPAPAGAIIEARGTNVITGSQYNPLTTTEFGKYGSANPNEPRLLVTGYMVEGTLISFYISGTAAVQTAAWNSGSLSRLDLTFTIPGRLEIKKIDGSGNPLGGAAFVITPDPRTGTGSLTVADNGTNDEDNTAGTLLVSGVRLNLEYSVHESVTPTGYQTAADQKVTLTSAGKVTLTFTNRLGQLEIKKVDGSSNALGGAAFMITPDPRTGTGSLTVADNGTNDEDNTAGTLLVSGVRLNLEYSVHESVTPTGYQTAADQKVTLTSAGKVTLTFTNRLGQLEIKKLDGSSNALGGAAFVITPDPRTGTGSLTVADNGTNDEDNTAGTLLVSGARLNVEYTVHESVTPTGYQTAAEKKTTLTTADKVTLTFVNNAAGGGGGGGGGGAPPPPTPTPGVVNLAGKVDSNGQFNTDVTAALPGNEALVTVISGTEGHTASGGNLTIISVTRVTGSVPAAPGNFTLGSLVYDFSPSGATFNKPVTITIKYDPAMLPAGTDESRLVISWYDAANNRWVELTGTVDTINKTVTVQVTHFTLFAVFAVRPPAPAPTTVPFTTPPTSTAPSIPATTTAAPPTPTILVTTSPAPQATTVKPSVTPALTTTGTPGAATPASSTPVEETVAVKWGLLVGIIAGVAIIAGIIITGIVRQRRINK